VFQDLKMAVSRFQMASNKKAAMLKQQCREVAVMLSEDPPKEEKARIRAEALIRDDNMIEAYEILQLECELLAERIKYLELSKGCPPDLVSCISDLMYAAPRVDIPELQTIRLQFRAKYGKDFEERALNNTGGILNERVVTKLSIQPPAAYLVQTYLEKICEQYEVDWKPRMHLSASQMAEPMAAPVGYDVQVAPGTGLSVTTGQSSHMDDDPDYKKPPPPMPPPVVNGTPYMPTRGDEFGEVDIFVPSAPTAPPGEHGLHSANTGHDKGSGGGGGGDDAPGAAGGGDMGSSYQDLVAKFESLQK
jgi:vacuolar protein sorting-associated protein IST1